MSDREVSVHPARVALAAPRDASPRSPARRLFRHLGPRAKVLLLLFLAGLAIILLLVLALYWAGAAAPAGLLGQGSGLEPLRSRVAEALPHLHAVSPGVAGVALLAVLYLLVGAWISMRDRPSVLQSSTEAAVAGLEPSPAQKPGDESTANPPASLDDAGAHGYRSQALADIHRALQLGNQQVGAAIGETARRTLALCGAFDSCNNHVQVAGADLDAIQDEAAHTQQLMASLRALLLSVGGHCQAIDSAAHRMRDSAVSAEVAQRIDELLEVLSAEIVHCHQLSERIGGAGRSSERRIDAIRRSIEALDHQAERGLREGHQVMVLTRQIDASLAEGSQQLNRLAVSCAALDAPCRAASPQSVALSHNADKA